MLRLRKKMMDGLIWGSYNKRTKTYRFLDHKADKWIRSNNEIVKLWLEVTSSKKYIKKKKLEEQLIHKLSVEWGDDLRGGGIILVKKDNSYELYKNTKKNKIDKLWTNSDKDKNIKMIITSGPSLEGIEFFVIYIMKKCSSKQINELLRKNTLKILIKNPKKFFMKEKINTNKDYVLKRLPHFYY